MKPLSTYKTQEVRYWVEDWETKHERKDTKPGAPLRNLLVLVDIERAITTLNLKERQAVLLCGQCGLSERTAGVLVGVSQTSMARRYRSALENMTTYLNGAHGCN